MELYGQCPPIEKMDASLSTLKACKCVSATAAHSHDPCDAVQAVSSLTALSSAAMQSYQASSTAVLTATAEPHGRYQLLFAWPACRHLALSTNNIEKISSLSGMDNLRILSLGRNLLKKIENVEVVADTLEELWLSYNQIEKLVSLRSSALTSPIASSAIPAAGYQWQNNSEAVLLLMISSSC